MRCWRTGDQFEKGKPYLWFIRVNGRRGNILSPESAFLWLFESGMNLLPLHDMCLRAQTRFMRIEFTRRAPKARAEMSLKFLPLIFLVYL